MPTGGIARFERACYTTSKDTSSLPSGALGLGRGAVATNLGVSVFFFRWVTPTHKLVKGALSDTILTPYREGF